MRDLLHLLKLCRKQKSVHRPSGLLCIVRRQDVLGVVLVRKHLQHQKGREVEVRIGDPFVEGKKARRRVDQRLVVESGKLAKCVLELAVDNFVCQQTFMI